MSDYGRIGDYIGPVAAKKLSAVDIDANSSNQHEFGGNDALRRLLGTGEDRRASQGHGIPTALMYLSDDDAPAVADLETTWYDARRNNPNRSAEWRLYYAAMRTDPHGPSRRPHVLRYAQGQSPADRHHTA